MKTVNKSPILCLWMPWLDNDLKCFKRISIIFPFFYICLIQFVFGGRGSLFFLFFRFSVFFVDNFFLFVPTESMKLQNYIRKTHGSWCVLCCGFNLCFLWINFFNCICLFLFLSFMFILSFLYLWWINTIYYYSSFQPSNSLSFLFLGRLPLSLADR